MNPQWVWAFCTKFRQSPGVAVGKIDLRHGRACRRKRSINAKEIAVPRRWDSNSGIPLRIAVVRVQSQAAKTKRRLGGNSEASRPRVADSTSVDYERSFLSQGGYNGIRQAGQ